MKPMLAVEAPKNLKFPLYATPKLDGIRCCITQDLKAITRSLKPIPNDYIRSQLEGIPELNGMDGELIVGDPTAEDCYHTTQGAVMTKAGRPENFTFFVFDYWNRDGATSWELGQDFVSMALNHIVDERVKLLGSAFIKTQTELDAYENDMLQLGYEGLILRYPGSPYKFGRSTAKEGYLLKLKRFVDAEATIVGFEELMRNGNEAKTNALGRTERSSHRAGLVGGGVLGGLLCHDLASGQAFTLGTGFNAKQRSDIWARREELMGKLVKYKSFKIGERDAPRFPVFLGFRDPSDL